MISKIDYQPRNTIACYVIHSYWIKVESQAVI